MTTTCLWGKKSDGAGIVSSTTPHQTHDFSANSLKHRFSHSQSLCLLVSSGSSKWGWSGAITGADGVWDEDNEEDDYACSIDHGPFELRGHQYVETSTDGGQITVLAND